MAINSGQYFADAAAEERVGSAAGGGGCTSWLLGVVYALASDENLRDEFAKYGEVTSAKIIRDAVTHHRNKSSSGSDSATHHGMHTAKKKTAFSGLECCGAAMR
jgi:hypothetical protein